MTREHMYACVRLSSRGLDNRKAPEHSGEIKPHVQLSHLTWTSFSSFSSSSA